MDYSPRKLRAGMDISEDLIDKIVAYLVNLKLDLPNIHVDNRNDRIEIIGQLSANNRDEIIRILIVLSKDFEQGYIPILFVPSVLKHNGIGKRMIRVVYDVLKKHRYELFHVQMVESFYRSMLNRGALRCEESDMLQIVETTCLE